jgi:UDP-glucuronate 4-epimerase
VFASSSSVYGINKNFPWREDDAVLNPISPYASTKISGELLGHVYSHLYDIRFVVLRFFTVYGPRQRPDLAIHLFSKKILGNEPIPFFGDGSTRRDYTYVTDTVNGIINAIHYDKLLRGVQSWNHQTVSLSEMIATLEEVFDKKPSLKKCPSRQEMYPDLCRYFKAKEQLGYMPEQISGKE